MSEINPDIEESWKNVLFEEFQKDGFKKLKKFIISEKKQFQVYPPSHLIFAAFKYTPFEKVKIVIIGQDPYHGPGQANGLCFSVADGVTMPPSLQNIFKELHTDLGFKLPISGNLEKWARQGVLLLNATLTVRSRQAGSHQKKGWEDFTDAVIKTLSEKRKGLVFILWGRFAQYKESLIDRSKHHVIKSAHPSPLSAYAGFFGSRPFSKANKLLAHEGIVPVNWDLE